MHAVVIAALSTMGSANGIAIERPIPVVVLVNVPRSTPARLRTADIIEAGNTVLAAHTDLALVDPAQVGVSEAQLRACRGESRLLCWANALAVPSSRSRWLLVVAPLADGQRSVRASTMLLDGERALAIEDADPTVVLNRIFEEATVHSAPLRIDVEEPAALQRYFQTVYADRFASVWADAGHATRFAGVELVAEPGLTVEVDGRIVGTTGHTKTRLTRLRPGRHRVALRDPKVPERRFDTDVVLASGEDSTIEVDFEQPLSSKRSVPMVVASGVLVGLGAASTAWGATRPRRLQPCFAAECAGDRTTFDGLVPIGVGLITTGAVLGVSSLIVDEDDALWVVVGATIAGLAAGAVTAAVR